jgi:hypothetical protein
VAVLVPPVGNAVAPAAPSAGASGDGATGATGATGDGAVLEERAVERVGRLAAIANHTAARRA